MRHTPIRQQILDLFNSSSQPLSADDFLSHLSVNKTTIYRQLDTLARHGLIHPVYLSDRTIRYELSSRPHHHHLICTTCHTITDISIPHSVEQAVSSLPSTSHFLVKSHSLEFFGLCSHCQSVTLN